MNASAESWPGAALNGNKCKMKKWRQEAVLYVAQWAIKTYTDCNQRGLMLGFNQFLEL